jgi:hypothetical protein
MIDGGRLMAELICYANGAELTKYSENLVIDDNGELIRETHVTAVIPPDTSEMIISIGKSSEGNE